MEKERPKTSPRLPLRVVKVQRDHGRVLRKVLVKMLSHGLRFNGLKLYKDQVGVCELNVPLDAEVEEEDEGDDGGDETAEGYIGRKAYLLEDKQIPSVGVFDEVYSIWMAFGENTRDLGSFGEETDEITDLHQILEEILLTGHGDGVAGINRHCRDPSSKYVRELVTASGRG
ncbi:hypothetical protein Tco_0792055 [Tanacetum coccineum]